MPIDPVTAGMVVQGTIAASQAISRGGPRRQYKWNKRAAQDTNAMNRDNAIWALEQNKKIQNEQRVYDSPEAQMARYKTAGLNPHLIYGGGSGSSGGTFPISTQGIAPSRIDAPSASYPDIAGSFVQAGQALAQTDLTQQKTIESENKSALIEIQRDIAKTNPMLNQNVYLATTYALEQAALVKSQQDRFLGSFESHGDAMTRGEKKVQMSVDKMSQDLKLGTEDIEIRNKILESKEYQNALLEIQKEWMQDGDITPQHIYQGLMLLLGKMMVK